jgi:hypothetical protein
LTSISSLALILTSGGLRNTGTAGISNGSGNVHPFFGRSASAIWESVPPSSMPRASVADSSMASGFWANSGSCSGNFLTFTAAAASVAADQQAVQGHVVQAYAMSPSPAPSSSR